MARENTQQFWVRVRAIEKTLKENSPDGVYLSTLASDNGLTPGLIKIALPFVAAQCLAKRTHEIATPEQIEAYKLDMERERRHIEARRRWAGNMPDVFVVPQHGARTK